MRKVQFSVRSVLIVLLVVGVVVGAVIPGLEVLFIVCAVLGGFLILGAFAGSQASTTTGANHDAMLRGRPYTDATDDAMRRAAHHQSRN